jgi:RHS repeat-associated protein
MKLNLNSLFMKSRIIFLLGFILMTQQAAKAQFLPEIFSQKKSGEVIKQRLSGGFPKYIDTVTDDKFASMVSSGAWRNSFKHKSVVNRITLSIKDTTRAMQKFDYLFNFTVDTFDSRNRRGSFNIVMRMSYDPASHQAYIDKVVYQFAKSHKFILKLNSIIDSAASSPGVISVANLQTNFILESEIIVERYYLGSYTTTVNALSHNYVSKDKLKISWAPPATSAPNRYELEWAYIDTAGIKPDSLKYDFLHNSSRVTLTKTFYTINTVYDAGVLIYRVRRVKPDSVLFKYDKFSNWYPTVAAKGYVKNYTSAHKLYIKSHEDMGKNWDYQVAFAEEGMKKEVINYFDGSLKRRQGVTLLNTNNFALVDESVYDNHGREAIKIIPAPSDSNTIRYYPNFNLNVAGKHYSSRDFDTSTTSADRCNGNYTAKPLGTQSGAGRYYSTANPDKTNENAAIPDAQGYALVQTRLMPDPTGRVMAQGGVGKAHQLGSGHETKYTYGTADQTELDQLFGSEMGIANHYKKNAVIDPNGQVSISYTDQHGRVVATALTGGVPGMVDSLANFKKAKFEMVDLGVNDMPMSNALKTRYDFIALAAGTHKIFYKLEAPDFQFGCLGLKSCYTCRYDLAVSLYDDCGNKIMDFKRPIGRLRDTSCTPLVFTLKDSVSKILGATASGDSISFYLNAGTYHLEKTLTVNTDSVENKINMVLANDSTCFKKFDGFLADEMGQIDFSDCGCDTCSNMDSLTYCETRKQLMLEDVSPDGQYFGYNETDFTVSDATSILRMASGQRLYSTIAANKFKDETGRIDTVWSAGGINFKLPNALTVEEFTTHWKETWAEALLPLHPEYCYYKYCIDSLETTTRYDDDMMAIDNYDTAVLYGYFDPLNYRTDYESNPDPFFVKPDGSLKSAGIQFQKKLENLSAYTVGGSQDPLLIQATTTNLWQFTKAIGYCENVTDSFERQSCFKFYYADNVKNNWMNDDAGKDNYWAKFKALYYQMKQQYIEARMGDKVTGDYCVKKIGVNACSDANYKTKLSQFIRYESNNPFENILDSIKKEKNKVLDSLKSNNTCDVNVAHWDAALKLCANYATYRDSILYNLLLVCEAGSLNPKAPNIMGSMDIPAGLAKGKRFTSFEQVLKYFIGTNYKTALCNTDLISSPRASGTDYENNTPKEANDCVCDKVKEEIKQFKGCSSRKDSSELSTEGLLVNDFMNAMVKYNLLSLGSSIRRLDSCADLSNVITKLFIPVLGGTSSSIVMREKVQTQYLNEKTFTVYNGNMANGCSFAIRLLNNTSTFTAIDLSKKATIRPISQGVFEYKFTYGSGASGVAHVYTTCFNNIGKCSPHLSASDLDNFTQYFNGKYNTAMPSREIEQLVGQCGSAAFPNVITDKLNTYYLRYGSCPDYYRNYKEPKDIHMINTLNQMMRPAPYLYRGVKRDLTTDEKAFNCNTADFLTLTKDYHLYKPFAGNKYDNYWWVNPRFIINTINIVGGPSIPDTVWLNNINKDPYFVGGFWIGARCADIKDSVCFTSFGDPYKQLGKGSKPTLTQIDSLSYMRWDNALGSFIVSARNRTSPNDSVILTINNQCKTQCNPLVRTTEIAVSYKDVFIKPGAGGALRLSNTKASLGYRAEIVNPFMDMINGLAKNTLLGGSDVDIRGFKKAFNYQPNYFEPLYPVTDGFKYTMDYTNDTVLVGKLGTGSNNYCKFGFRKAGTVRNWSFNNIRVFKDLRTDAQAIVDAIGNDQVDMANYHFTVKAGKINSPGDTTWYDLRGWSSCWKFSEITLISGNGKALFSLPDDFVGNCNCLTCPEAKRWSDSLYTEYPTLNPNHPNYGTIVENYINRKLNTTLSFSEIQSVWDACGVGNRTFLKQPLCDYRLAVKNTDCANHADSALRNIMIRTGIYFETPSYKTADSTIYMLDFNGLAATEIAMLQDSLVKYFNNPYCTKFKHHKNYRDNNDIMLWNVNGTLTASSAFGTWFTGVKSSLFGSAAITNTSTSGVQYRPSIDYDWATISSAWIAEVNIQALSHAKRQQFVDTLTKWIAKDPDISYKINFYVPQLVPSDNSTLCLKPLTGSTTVCYTCDTFKQRLLDYQYNIAAKRKNPSAAMKADSLEIYLSAQLGRKLEVISGAANCITCGNENLYVCQTSSERLDSIVALLNKLAKDKKLNVGWQHPLLGAAYIKILNTIKPTGTVLNAPSYQMKSNKYGGWMLTLKYNTKQYDIVQVEDVKDDTLRKFGKGIEGFKNPSILPANGTTSSFILTAIDSLYGSRNYAFKMLGLAASQCCQMPNTMLCPQPYTREYEIEDAPCHQEETQQAFTNAVLRYQDYLDSMKRKLAMDYHTHCFSKAKQEFRLGMFKQRYHVTLYYYDQAGNLTKTVPPEGVKELNLTGKQDSIKTYRNDIAVSTKFVNSYHTLPTNYKYNSLNQLVWQKTPDGGESRFWYDRLGRLMLSQNAVQKAKSTTSTKVYSYTRYDALGRIAEVGEIVNTAVDSVQMLANINYYNTWLATSTARSQITKTYYDYAVMAKALNQFSEGQRNLRGRVSSVAYYDNYAADSSQYTRATHYSYDIHGNVDHLVHDFPEMESVKSRFKHITYNYDLISGKVHSVAYQAGKADQWYHRYQYDADNRLTLAETSTDSVIWDKDAEYKYYKHGPLARTLLGEHAVQGVDYAYTLHGWLKGVNSNTLQANRDIGKDGTGYLRKHTARDAYGFTLGYFTDNTGTGFFDGDYKSIGTTGFEANTAGSPLANNATNMYNGNITHMVTAVGVLMGRNGGSPVATAYRYDQLNRLKSVQSYNGINISGSLQTAWKENFKYDANGNITKLTRYSAIGIMDNLSYNYKAGTNQLTHVDETVSNADYKDDIDDQSTGNYTYDALGNLTHDVAEEIDSIQWNVYGKIKNIIRTATSKKPSLAFGYDAAGQRVIKIVKSSLLQTDWKTTLYARDAQGNTMATYTKKYSISQDTGMYRQINNALVAATSNSDFATFINSKYLKNSQFAGALTQAIESSGLYSSLVDQYSIDSILKWSPGLSSMIMSAYCNYTTTFEQDQLNTDLWNNMRDSILQVCNLNQNQLLLDMLAKDASNELLNQLNTIDPIRLEQIFIRLGGVRPQPLPAMIGYIRGFPDPTVANEINMLFNPTEVATAINGCSTALFISVTAPTGGSMNFCAFLASLPNCGAGAATATWPNFLLQYVDHGLLHSIIKAESNHTYLINLLLTHGGSAGIINVNKDAIALALSGVNTLTLSEYLQSIYQYFGSTVYSSVMSSIGSNITIRQELTVDELHIYGSSRHGIYKPSKKLLVNSYRLNDLGTALDSTYATVNYHYFKRTLSLKQYELTNHLGNVLATVLDRKTFVQDSTGSDTLLYYKADVSTAGLYYAFGSSIKEMSYSSDTSNKYRYGFNGMELDNETSVEGGHYDFGARIYDSRIGRWLALDPLMKKYPNLSPYQLKK